MSNYELKKQARIERLEARIMKLRKFAEGKDLSLFGEAKSGIPIGQPILVGHHSERRHRRHLERINRLVQAGYDAGNRADQLEQRIESIKSANAIQTDNPDAVVLINEKINQLTKSIEYSKKINKLLLKFSRVDVYETIEHFKALTDDDSKFIVKHLTSCAHFYACKDTRLLTLSTTNSGAEIRRLKKRLIELEKVSQGFEPFTINEISVSLVDGQVQIDFPKKPSEATRQVIKGYGMAFKWSSYSKKWVRKYTGSMGQWFFQELKKNLANTTYDEAAA